MNKLQSLVIYYSLEGATRLVSEAIAESLGADVVALQPDAEPRAKGFARYLQYGWQRITHRRMGIAPLGVDPQQYDLVLIGSPAWASAPAPAVQTLLRTVPLSGPRIALFCTHEGGPGRTLDQMASSVPNADVVGRLDIGLVRREPAAARQRAVSWAREIAVATR